MITRGLGEWHHKLSRFIKKGEEIETDDANLQGVEARIWGINFPFFFSIPFILFRLL